MSLRRALVWSYLEKYGTFAVGLVSTAIISRLLGPADIGVFAVGMSLVGIVAVVRELGVSTYVVQEAELTSERVRAAFTLMAGMGMALALLVLLISWPAGVFYGDPRVTQILAVLALGFALTPFGSISQALLARDLQFGTLTWIRLLYALVSAAVSIGLAVAGFGPISLAWASVAAAGVNAFVSMAVRPHPMRPTRSPETLRRVLAVGGPATVVAMIDAFDSSLPELLLGRLQSLSAAGLFSRAKGLSLMAHQILARATGPVFFSAFAALQREGQRPDDLYEKGNACITAVGWSALGALAVLAQPIVALLFGPQWAEVVPLLRWLSAAAAVALLTSGANLLLQASGGAKDSMWAKVCSLPGFAVSLFIGGWIGALAMAASTLVGTAFTAFLLGAAVKRRVGIGWRSQLLAVRQSLPIACAGAGGASAGLLVDPAGAAQALAAVAVGAVGCTLLAGAALLVGSHPLKDELRRAFLAFSDRRSVHE